MSATERLDIFTPFLKKERDADGVLWVEGKFTGPDLDSDGQRMDPGWLKSAIPAYMKVGNVREGHDPHRAIGKAVQVWETDDHSWHMRAKIVDPVAEKKIEHGILSGFSIGVANYGLAKAADAPNGKVCRGDVVEVSAVDRPSLPSALFRMAELSKATGMLALVDVPAFIEGDDLDKDVAPAEDVPRPSMLLKTGDGQVRPMTAALVDELTAPTVVANPDDPDAAGPEALAKAFGDKKAPPFGKDGKPEKDDDKAGDDEDEESDDEGDGDGKPAAGKKKPAEKADSLDVDAVVKAVLAELEKRKFTQGERDDAADSGAAMEDGSFPIKTRADLGNAISSYGRAKDKDAAKAHIIARAKALGAEVELPDDWRPAAKKTAEPELVKDDTDTPAKGDLDLTSDEAAEDEMDDIAAAKAVIGGIACLIRSEAMGLALGDLGEVCDITLLAQVAELMKWFLEREAMEIKRLTEPADTEGGVLEMAANPTLIKAAEDAAASFRERLEKAAAAPVEPAQAPAADETSAEKAEAPTIDADVLTKAITEQVTASIAGQLGTYLTKAMDPVISRVAEVETLLRSTPRPGGPAVTAVRKQVAPAEAADKAEKAQKATILKSMIAADPGGPYALAWMSQLAELEKPAA